MPSLVDTGAYLDQLYQQKFGRVPDAEGKAYWKAELESGKITPEKVSQIFDNTDEAKQVKASREQAARDFLEKTYAEELGREPDAEGAEYWANEINSGRQTQAEVVNNIRQSEEYQERQAPEEEEWQQEYDNQLNQATNDLSRTDISQQADIPAQEREADPTSDPEQPVPSQAERKREAAEAADREHLNEASRELYFQELRDEMIRISKARKEGEPELYIPSDKFKREIGRYAGKRYTVHGEVFEGDDNAWDEYLSTVLPTDEDEDKLVNEYLKGEWIQYREWKGD